MTSGGYVTENFKCTSSVALDISDSYKENHNGVSGLVRARGCGSADDALKVCALKIPTSTISCPDLYVELIVIKRKVRGLSSPSPR